MGNEPTPSHLAKDRVDRAGRRSKSGLEMHQHRSPSIKNSKHGLSTLMRTNLRHVESRCIFTRCAELFIKTKSGLPESGIIVAGDCDAGDIRLNQTSSPFLSLTDLEWVAQLCSDCADASIQHGCDSSGEAFQPVLDGEGSLSRNATGRQGKAAASAA